MAGLIKMLYRKDFFEAMGEYIGVADNEKVLEIGAGLPTWKEYSEKVGKDGLFVSLDVFQQIQKRSKNLLAKMSNNGQFPESLVTANADVCHFSMTSLM